MSGITLTIDRDALRVLLRSGEQLTAEELDSILSGFTEERAHSVWEAIKAEVLEIADEKGIEV